MKKLYSLLLLMVALIALTSCQKEIVSNNPSTDTTGGGVVIPPSTNGNLLVKIYGRQGADSTVLYYTYDANGKMLTSTAITSLAGATRSWYGYERNAAGLITKAKQLVTAAISPIQADTAVTLYYYSTGATPQITYSVHTMNIAGISITDSTLYAYNSTGQLTKTTEYQSDPFSGIYTTTGSTVYTYDAAGNTIKIAITSIIGGVSTQATTTTYTYDDKNDPLNLTEAESIIIRGEAEQKRNHLKQTLVSPGSGAPDYTFTYTYTYNSANKPATSTGTQTPGNLATNYTFYYQ